MMSNRLEKDLELQEKKYRSKIQNNSTQTPNRRNFYCRNQVVEKSQEYSELGDTEMAWLSLPLRPR